MASGDGDFWMFYPLQMISQRLASENLANSDSLKENLTKVEAWDMSPNEQSSIGCLCFKLRTTLRNGLNSVLFIKVI